MSSVHQSVTTVHIVAGGISIVAGFAALFAAKGSVWHRRFGRVFVDAMLVMTLVGAALAAIWGRQPRSNIPTALITAYLVVTALAAVRPLARASRRLEWGLMAVTFTLGLIDMGFGMQAANRPDGQLDGIPAPPFFVFGTIALCAGLGDWRMIRDGGSASLRGARRITRHLWRMTLSLLIAAFSFFLGQAKVIPKPVRIVPLLAIPPLVVLVALGYWVWRIRVRRRPPRHPTPDPA